MFLKEYVVNINISKIQQKLFSYNNFDFKCKNNQNATQALAFFGL